jgi:hypothetical protein
MSRTLVAMAVGLTTLAAAVGSAWGQSQPVPPSSAERAVGPEFNGDAFGDLAVGVPGEDLASTVDVGVINVLYGSSDGLLTTPQPLLQGNGGVAGTAEAGDRFGSALARGDFNSDGFFDVAVGVPGEDVATSPDAGAVNILLGSAQGLTGGPLLLQVNPEAGDAFGSALAVGDVDDDGFDDLAVGAPTEDLASDRRDTGAVTVIFGSASGLTTARRVTIFQGNTQVAGTAEQGDRFGASLAAGLFDPFLDLAVGAPGEDVGATVDAGAVNVLAGSLNGLTGGTLLAQGNAEAGDQFGAALSTGLLDGQAFEDLAVGVPGEDVGTLPDAGAVSFYSGSTTGLAGPRLLFQGNAGVAGSAEAGDRFGSSVSSGDYNDVFPWELAIGVPNEDFSGVNDAGLVNVLVGAPAGPAGGQLIAQDLPEELDNFGETLTGGLYLHDFNNDGFSDLAVGASRETIADRTSAGAVSVLYGAQAGLSGVSSQHFFQGNAGLAGVAERDDRFGAALG